MRVKILVLMTVGLLLPTRSQAQADECDSCCYCDLAAGKCKDISEFPGGLETGYPDCEVNGMNCHLWGTPCASFAFGDVGPDGMVRTTSTYQDLTNHGRTVTQSVVSTGFGTTYVRDCGRFLVAIRLESAGLAVLSMRTNSMTL